MTLLLRLPRVRFMLSALFFYFFILQLAAAEWRFSKDGATIVCKGTAWEGQLGQCNCISPFCPELDLSGLGIVSVVEDAFLNLGDLEILNLANNTIAGLTGSPPLTLPDLLSSSMARSESYEVPPVKLFQDLVHLRTLDLGYNQISLLSADMLPPAIRTLVVEGNPLTCCTVLQLRMRFNLLKTKIILHSSCIDIDGEHRFTQTVLSAYISGNSSTEHCDPCSISPCHMYATCFNHGSKYACMCNSGWVSSGNSCLDMDECASGLPTPCSQHCINTEGSFMCGCEDMLYLDLDGVSCKACSLDPHCTTNQSVCTFKGEVACRLGMCIAGYENKDNTADSMCVDIDECLHNACPIVAPSPIGFNQFPVMGNNSNIETTPNNFTCINTIGSYLCLCSNGFFPVKERCLDVNECMYDGFNQCPPQKSICRNTIGSYKCICKLGYEDDGNECTDIDECTMNTHDCSVHATCVNIDGRYICRCNPGFFGDENDTCQACNTLPNCNVTLCGPPMEDEVDGTLFTDMSLINNTRLNASTSTNRSGSSTDIWPFRCRACVNNYYITEDWRCSLCTPPENCLIVHQNCSLDKDLLCEKCPPEFFGNICDKEGVNFTMESVFLSTAPALEQLRIGLKDVLGVASDESIQVYSFAPAEGEPVIVRMLIKRRYVDLLYDKATKSVVLGSLNISAVNTLRGGEKRIIVMTEDMELGRSRGYVTTWLTVGLAISLVAVVGVALLVFHQYRRRKPHTVDEMINQIKKSHKWTEVNTEEAAAVLRCIKGRSGWLPRSQFVILDQLGTGAFGAVSKGVLFNDGVAALCAVKELREASTKSYAEFIHEATLLKELNHENIVNLLGLSAEEDPDQDTKDLPSGGIYILLEYMTLGDLRCYLLSRGDAISANEKAYIGYQVSLGLAYLATIGVVHRDVSARNILLSEPFSSSNGYPVVKVSDMGLARVTGIDRQYVKEGDGLLPLRWMAPESITDSIYTEASDVWGFGVALWEIAANGTMPYVSAKSHQLLSTLEQGNRLQRPNNCDNQTYKIMLRCWSWLPQDRPTFAQLVEELRALVRLDDIPKTPQSLEGDPANGDSKIRLTSMGNSTDAICGPESFPGYAWIDKPTGWIRWKRLVGRRHVS